MAGRHQTIGVAVAAVPRETDVRFDPAEDPPVRRLHEQGARCEQYGVGEVGTWSADERAFARGPAIAGTGAVSAETLADERLMHQAIDRLAPARKADERAPGRHAADEGLGPVDRVEHPDVFRVGSFGAELLADDAVLGKVTPDQRAHCCLGGSIRGGYRIEAAATGLVFDPEGGAKKRQDRIAGHISQLVDECREINRCHQLMPVMGYARHMGLTRIYPLLFVRRSFILLQCGSAASSCHRRPPWAFPP